MALRTGPSHYSRLSTAMHWLMLVLIALTCLFIELRELFARGSIERDFMRMAHFVSGWTVLALVCEWHGDIGARRLCADRLHAAAALTHHWLWHDDTLRRMLPGRSA